MSQLITVKLARPDGTAWGFRLQGGKDFGTPLVIQKVNGGSPAEKAGLIAGDSVVKVNNIDVFNMRHKDAQDVIIKAGQVFEMTVQRGGSTWKPTVTPVGTVTRAQPAANNVSPVTKTSLAAKKQDYTPIGASHNLSPKGFNAPHMNGSADGPRLVNKQYNSPLALYSEESIAETLSAQAEVLSTGALGVNFKKNEKNYNAANSEVYKMLQEAEKEPKTPEPVSDSAVSGGVSPVTTGLRHVQAPENKPPSSTPQLPPGQNICADCERLIVGVFVRIKDKNLHVECFKCATCGSSLKNVGYYNINNKLYCDIHAKLAAKSCAPSPNMVPITVSPGGKAPAGAISSALASQSVPSPSPLSPSGNLPPPFQLPDSNTLIKDHTVANLSAVLTMAKIKEYKESGTNTEPENLSHEILKPDISSNTRIDTASNNHAQYVPFVCKTGVNLSGPKPFSSVQPSTPSHAPITSPLSSTLPKSSSTTAMPERKEWPPSKSEYIPTASPLYIAPSSRVTPNIQITQFEEMSNIKHDSYSEESKSYEMVAESKICSSSSSSRALDHKMSICSAEVTDITGRRSVTKFEMIGESADANAGVIADEKERPSSPPPLHRKDSVLGDEQILPAAVGTETEENAETESKQETARQENVNPCPMINIECESEEKTSIMNLETSSKNTQSTKKIESSLINTVPQEYKSPMVKALTIASDRPFSSVLLTIENQDYGTSKVEERHSEEVVTESEKKEVKEIKEVKEVKFPHAYAVPAVTPMASALTTAPSVPFTPVPQINLEPVPLPPETTPYIPPPIAITVEPKTPKRLDACKSPFVEALTTAPERPYSPMVMGFGTSQDSQVEDFMKDVPPPPRQKMTMLSALTTASDRPFTPQFSVTEIEQEHIEQKTTERKTIEHIKSKVSEISPVATKPASHIIPSASAFKPLNTATSLKPYQTPEKATSFISLDTAVSAKFSTETQSYQTKTFTGSDTQIVEEERKSEKPVSSGLQRPYGIPGYQKDIYKKSHVEQKPVTLPVNAIQKPVTTLQPGQYQPNSAHTTFQPVTEDNPRSMICLSPSVINKAAPTLPYYQASLVPQQCLAVETNVFDPQSPGISRSPSPMPGRSASPFPSQILRAKSPAQGPPPNPLKGRLQKKPVRDERFMEAKQKLSEYLTVDYEPARQPNSVVERAQYFEQRSEIKAPTSKQQEEYLENVEVMQQASQHTSATKKVSQVESMKHVEQVAKSQEQSVETSADNRVQIQRTKRCTEEFERTQKAKVIAIETFGSKTNQISQNVRTASQGFQKPATRSQTIELPKVTNVGNRALAFQKPAKDAEFGTSSRSNSLPGSSFFAPKPFQLPQLTKGMDNCDPVSNSASRPNVPQPSVGGSGAGSTGKQAGAIGISPKRGRGILNLAGAPGSRVPLCGHCNSHIR